MARKLRLSQPIVWWKRRLLCVPSFVPARRILWTPSVVKRFGKEPDRRIARDLGVLPMTVKYKREALGIPPFQYAAPIVRTARWKTLLKLTNPELAKRFRMSSKAIAKLRHDYGIPAPGRPTWTPDVLRRLGKQSDVSIARELGIQSPSVLYKRRRLGIPRWESGRRWKKSELRLLGRSSDVDVARRLGVLVNLVRVRRKALGMAPYRKVAPIEKSPRLKDSLRLPNRELGERYGLSPDVIHRLRRQHGIPAPGRPPAGRWTKAVVARLGRVSDAQVARELGIDTSSVCAKRQALGIRRWSPKRVWTKAECRLLGRLPDRQIARRLGLSADTVGDKRREIGMACAPLTRPARG